MSQTTPEKLIVPAFDSRGNGFVAVHTGHPLAPVALGHTFDFSLRGSGFLLSRMLWLAVNHAGLWESLSGEDVLPFTGTLGDGIIFIYNRDPLKAAAIVLAELKAVALAGICQIGVCTASGWEPFHPQTEIKLNWLLDIDRTLLDNARYDAKLAAFIKSTLPPSDTFSTK